jgi:hypothetical protein
MLMQLPTPLDCINSTPFAPPIHEPASMATPSSSLVRETACMDFSAWQRVISLLWPASGT